jgi:hypothetical protein
MCRRLIIIWLAITSVASFGWSKAKSDGFRYVTPLKYDKKVDVLVSGKHRDYFLLEPGKQIELKLQGPSRLKILSRALLSSASDSVEYTFLTARKSSRTTVTFTHATHASDKITLTDKNEGVVSVMRNKIVDVPRGEQHYLLYLPRNAKRKLLFRFALSTNEFTNGTPVTAMTPTNYTTAGDLVSREEIAEYYRLSGTDKISLQLIGPATLKVLSRVEFDSNMTGRQKWRVQVVEAEKVKATYLLSARKSQSTSYKDVNALVPSRAESFFVEIPAGEHRYEFLLPDNHRSVLMRFLLPKNQLGRE